MGVGVCVGGGVFVCVDGDGRRNSGSVCWTKVPSLPLSAGDSLKLLELSDL